MTPSPSVQQYQAAVIAHQEVAPRHYRLKLKADAVAQAAQAGHFIHILPRTANEYDPLLRRAFSILKKTEDSIEILYRLEGRGPG